MAGCKICGAEFEPTRKGHIYCSEACRRKGQYHYEKNEKRLTCAMCGGGFTSSHSLTKYCSDSCRKKAKSERNLEWREKQRQKLINRAFAPSKPIKIDPYYLRRGSTMMCHGDSITGASYVD